MTSEPDSSHVVRISVGRPRPVVRHGRPGLTAIAKTAVDGAVRAAGVNLEGDDQADRIAHGGHDKAVYAYAEEDRAWWEAETGRTIEPATFGENLTTRGIDITSSVVGEHWTIGTAVLEVSEPRLPCWKLSHRLGDPGFGRRFVAAGRPGTYLRIVAEGVLTAGDAIRVAHVPDHGITIGDVARIRRDGTGAELLLTLDAISDPWKEWATRQTGRRRSSP